MQWHDFQCNYLLNQVRSISKINETNDVDRMSNLKINHQLHLRNLQTLPLIVNEHKWLCYKYRSRTLKQQSDEFNGKWRRRGRFHMVGKMKIPKEFNEAISIICRELNLSAFHSFFDVEFQSIVKLTEMCSTKKHFNLYVSSYCFGKFHLKLSVFLYNMKMMNSNWTQWSFSQS